MGFVSLSEDIEKNGEGTGPTPTPITIINGKPYHSEDARIERLVNRTVKPKNDVLKSVKAPSRKSLIGREDIAIYIDSLERELKKYRNLGTPVEIIQEIFRLKRDLSIAEKNYNSSAIRANALQEEICKINKPQRTVLTVGKPLQD